MAEISGSDSTRIGLDELALQLREFARVRGWEQFHSPKNLAMALIAECGELVDHFRWLSEEQSRMLEPDEREQVAMELADILIFLVRLADRLGVDLLTAASRKIALNELRYPAEKVFGSAKKACEHQD